jgi:plastocyanin
MLNLTSAALRRLVPLATLVGTLALVGTVSAAAAPDQSVAIDAFAFSPAEITVPVGGSVVWTNAQAGVPHTVTSVDATTFDSGVLATNNTFSFTFGQLGDFAYQCEIHPSMRGTVHVVAAAASADQSSVGPVDASAAPDASAAEATSPAVSSASTSAAAPEPSTAPVAQTTVTATPGAAPSAPSTATAAPTSVRVAQPTATPAAYYGY